LCRNSIFAQPINLLNQPVFDIKPLLEISGDDRQFVIELLESYLKQTGTDIEAIEKSTAQGDAQAVKFAAHRLRSSSGAVGAKNTAAACSEIETIIDDHHSVEKSVYLYIEKLVKTARQDLQAIADCIALLKEEQNL
jgi:HPt (histidine-containing phosphotransfer) domain-containing protein